VAGVIGHPVRHSLSPAIHNAAYSALGLDWVYLAFDVQPADGADAVRAAAPLGLIGLNVTMPHKDAAARAVDELTPLAAMLGAVNCVQVDGSRLIGHNTDGFGYVESLRVDEGIDVMGAHVVVVGAGGAARAVIVALAAAGASVAVVNRTADRAVAAAELAGARGRVGGATELASAEVVVNATSVGMDGSGLVVDVDQLADGAVVSELVYSPEVTPLMAAARSRGLRAVGGLGMLVHQAGEAIRLWSGQEPPIGQMWAAARNELAARTPQ
jgi:shikimate dehydrogenase